MIKDLKKPLTYEEQLEKLKAHKLKIGDEAKTLKILQRVNYYKLSDYGLGFRNERYSDLYKLGTSFELLYELFLFDEEIRIFLLKFLLKIEIYLRTRIANDFSLIKCKESPYNQHYDSENYYRKEKFQEVFNSLEKEKDNNSDSLVIKHHDKKYNGKMPLWVIVELLSFSNLSKYYNSLFESDKKIIADKLGVAHKVLSNHMHCLSVLRNKCAHSSRIYNNDFVPPAKLGSEYLKKYNDVFNDSLFAYCRIIYLRLPEEKDKKDFVKGLKSIISDYEESINLSDIGFPKDWLKVISV